MRSTASCSVPCSTRRHFARVKLRAMSIVVINAVTVPDDRREGFETHFAAMAGSVVGVPGLEAFELLQPEEGGRYLVYTRWASQAEFEAWRGSAHFAEAHARVDDGSARNTNEVWRFAVLQSEYATA
jgi:heme-degrading monooxygenase HmoA